MFSLKKKHNSAHCAYLTRPRRIKKKQAGVGCVTFCPTFYDSAIILKKSELCKKKRKKNNSKRNIDWISCLIHDSFVTRRLLYDFCESEYIKKNVLCYCAVFLQIKKEAEKNCQNYYKCCSKGGGLWGSGGPICF